MVPHDRENVVANAAWSIVWRLRRVTFATTTTILV
jgi:hypothetical protein